MAGVAGPALAQQAPNAGTLQRQLQQELSPRTIPQQPQAPAQGLAAPGGGPAVPVHQFVIDGVTLVPMAELQAAIAGQAGQSLTFAQLQDVAQMVADVYRRHGYFARAYLPAQDVSHGTVHIRVVEGRFGQVNLVPGQTRAAGAVVATIAGYRLQADQPYSEAALERGLLLANDLPGIQADGVLKAGSALSTSDLDLTVTDLPLLAGNIGINNYGARATGHVQALAGLSIDDPSGIGDQITLRGIGSAGQDDGSLGYGQLGYSLPVGSDGLRATVSGSYLHYELGANFADLDATGQSETASASLTYPLVRSTTASLWLDMTYTHGWYDDDASGGALHRRRIDAVTLGINGDGVDGWGGGGTISYSLLATAGSLDLSDLASDAAQDRAGPRAAGGYGKMLFDLARTQALGPQWFMRAHLSAQWAAGNLDSSEQFALGGPYGVRAYPINEAMGDDGALLNLELHRPLTEGLLQGLDLFGFFDTGAIRQHASLWAGAGVARNSFVLSGAGIGAGYPLGGFLLSGTVAMPIGPNPGGPYGHNQDGSDTGVTGWFSVSKTF